MEQPHAHEPQREPPSTTLIAAARAGSARLIVEAIAEMTARTRLPELAFIPAGEVERLPSPDDEVPKAVVPVVDGERVEGWLVASNVDEMGLRPWARWLGDWLAVACALERLTIQAFTDELTGAGNRRAFEQFLPVALEEARHRGRPLSLMVFDVDNFKRYNDEFGHDAGDAVLFETVALLRSVVRKGDRVFRIGGDEFVVVLSDPEGPRAPGPGHIESVDQLVSRFRQKVAELCLPQLGDLAPGSVTISAGLSTFPWDGQDARSLLCHADRLALESKRRGKNVITFGVDRTKQPEGDDRTAPRPTA